MNAALVRLTAISIALIVLTGCQSWRRHRQPATLPAPAPMADLTPVAPAPLDAALLKPGVDVFRLGPGDKLDIEVVGDADTRETVTVGPDGKIYYYVLPGTDVWGLTLSETRARIGSGLQRFMREKPAVSVSLRSVSSQRVWILGRIGTPGVYNLGGPTTLLDAIAQGGGLSSGGGAGVAVAPGSTGIAPVSGGLESADLSRAFIIRQGRRIPVDFQKLLREGDLSQNIYLQSDDFVFLPPMRTAEVHVLGAVMRPQSQKMSGGLTLAQAVALSGGTVPDAYLTNVAILRGSLTQPKVGIVDLASIVHGRMADVRLEPGDIIYVPYTPYRTLNRYVNLILDTFARTVGVNAGAHAAGGDVTATVGVNVTGGR